MKTIELSDEWEAKLRHYFGNPTIDRMEIDPDHLWEVIVYTEARRKAEVEAFQLTLTRLIQSAFYLTELPEDSGQHSSAIQSYLAKNFDAKFEDGI